METSEGKKPANPECVEGQHEIAMSASDSLQEKLRKLMGSAASVEEQNEGIGQVPKFLLESVLKKYFQPRIMAIGPLHNNKNKLEKGEEFKHQQAKRFDESNHPNDGKLLCDNILKEIESLKNCYDQELLKKFQGNDVDLALMLINDGYALIQFVKTYARLGGTAFHETKIKGDEVNHVVTDLILLVNQLPLRVLNLVMGERKESLTPSIHQFAEKIIETIRENDEKAVSTTDWSFGKENHLLDIIWKKLVKKEIHSRSEKITKAPPQQFHSVKDLQAAGIILEPNNPSSSLRDISFSGGFFVCKLKIPAFRVSEEGKFLLFNLIAFEMHPNFRKDMVVTSYISFLTSLMATKEDVEELRKAGILINRLPNDEDVLKTFRELTSSLEPYYDIFSNTKKELIDYFNDKTSMKIGKWFREAMHVYFRSPWTTIAFVSATILLIVAITQTVFSVLGYARHK